VKTRPHYSYWRSRKYWEGGYKKASEHNISKIRHIDNNEPEIFFLMEKYKNLPFIKCFLGDIRDKDRKKTITKGVDILFQR